MKHPQDEMQRRQARTMGINATDMQALRLLDVELLFDTWAPIVRAMDDVGHRLTPANQKAVCAFFDDLTAVMAPGS